MREHLEHFFGRGWELFGPEDSLEHYFECSRILREHDHFVYQSGDHGTDYIDKNVIYPNGRVRHCLAFRIAAQFMDDPVQVVVAPAVGAALLAADVAHYLNIAKAWQMNVCATEKVDGRQVLRREYDRQLVAGQKILVLDDNLRTGGTLREVITAVTDWEGNVIAAGCIWNRGGITAEDLGVPRLECLINRRLREWTEEQCKIDGPCAWGRPINTEVGHGADFLAKQTS